MFCLKWEELGSKELSFTASCVTYRLDEGRWAEGMEGGGGGEEMMDCRTCWLGKIVA